VELGPRAGDFYIVKSGLEEGALVVTNGAFRIDSELQIQAKPSMMSPSGGAPPPGHDHGSPEPVVTSSPESSHDAIMEFLSESEEVVESLTPVYKAYFAAQMALANDDHTGAVRASDELFKASSSVDMGAFSHAGHDRWMTILADIRAAATTISGSENIEIARSGFFELSKAAIDLHDSFGHAGGKDFYLTFCPMARDNAGAYWLQTVDIVWNSFYGEAMLRCGEIKQPLAPIDGETE